jgi:hypothetical protein
MNVASQPAQHALIELSPCAAAAAIRALVHAASSCAAPLPCCPAQYSQQYERKFLGRDSKVRQLDKTGCSLREVKRAYEDEVSHAT